MTITVTNTYEIDEEMMNIIRENMNRKGITDIIEELQEWDITNTEVNIIE